MLIDNISPNAGTSTKYQHTWLSLVELDLKGEFALQILDQKKKKKVQIQNTVHVSLWWLIQNVIKVNLKKQVN